MMNRHFARNVKRNVTPTFATFLNEAAGTDSCPDLPEQAERPAKHGGQH
jgi:hypothetical protein